MVVTGLAMILAQFDSLAPSICGNTRFVAVQLRRWGTIYICDTSGSELLKAS